MNDQRYRPMTTVDWASNQAFAQFRLWRKEVERILNGPMNGEDDEVKLNTVYIWAGAHAETLVEASQAEEPDLKIDNTKQLLDCLASCLTHSTFFREAREDFYNAKQKAEENTTTYYSRIIELFRLAEFSEDSAFLIADKLIHGCTNVQCKRKLMTKGKDVKVKDCLDLLRQFEAVAVTMKHFGESCKINATSANRDPSKQSQRNAKPKKNPKPSPQHQTDSKKRCSWCNGNPHPREDCPAREAKCTFCQKKGHYEKACIFKKKCHTKVQNKVEVSESESSESDQESYDIGIVSRVRGNQSQRNAKAKEILANVKFHTTTPTTLQGKVDTGAMVNCMPLHMLQFIGMRQDELAPSNACLRGVTGADLVNCGELDVKVTCNGHTRKANIMVTELGSELILGLDFCKSFKLVTVADTCMQRKVMLEEQVEAVHITDESEADYTPLKKKWGKYLPLGKKTGDPLQDLKDIFPETFNGKVGLFEGEVELKVTPEAKPVQMPPRSVPLSILPKLRQELDKMEQEGIIRPCPDTTDWVHNLVIVSKKNGELRICLDPRTLNRYLVRSVHYTASWEDAKHSFSKGRWFSTLDAKSGYWTKKLSHESQLLTAFNTPFKKYCFVRLPFGLSVSAEIFCEEMDKALDGIPGTFPCADDVKVQGSTEDRHDLHLLETVDRARKAGIKFNPDKCHIKKDTINYFGRVISPDGVTPCPKRVKAILEMQSPTNKLELQSFFGTVNFLATHIPLLSKKTYMMRGLVKKDVHFVWTKDMQQEFETIKQEIARSIQLIHFDTGKAVIIETDASLKGLGAVLIQDGKPVKFLSKSLTTTESDYSNIEREMLAVLFACEKLHTYIFGRVVTIHTDHKPLQSIFQKPISLAPLRLQRMLLRMRMYNLQVKYVGAKSVLLADTLSRLVQPGRHRTIPNLDVNIAQVLKVRPAYLESLQQETKADPALSELRKFINDGWPESMNDLPDILRPYWCFRDEMAVLDGILMKGTRVIVPSALHTETLTRLHDGHQGLTATLQRARRTVYWPNLQDEVSAMLLQCKECQTHANKKPRPPTRQISASRPMEIIGIDLMDYKGKSALVSVDYYSGYITFDFVESSTTDTIITTLNKSFQRFGLVEKILSDNGPCFRSDKFTQFCNALEIKHMTSSPYFHQGNGRVERSIQTVKQMLRKCNSDMELTMAIVAYHDTPATDLPSPAELFFNRRINTRLGSMYPATNLLDTQKQKLAEKRAAHLLQPKSTVDQYVPDQPVWYTEDGCPEWKPGYIESEDKLPDSYWIINEESNRRLRRNKHDIKPRFPVPGSKSCEARPVSPSVDQFIPSANAQQQLLPPPVQHSAFPKIVAPDIPLECQSPKTTRNVPPMEKAPTSKPAPTSPGPPPSNIVDQTPNDKMAMHKTPIKTRYGRQSKPTKQPDFIYQISGQLD